MADSQKLSTKRCYRCGFGIQMLDGNVWCGIIMKSESGVDCDYSPGFVRLYKPEPKVIQKTLKEQVVIKTTPIPKAKPIPIKQKPLSSSKKKISPQIKMF